MVQNSKCSQSSSNSCPAATWLPSWRDVDTLWRACSSEDYFILREAFVFIFFLSYGTNLFFHFLTGVQLSYNVVLVSDVQQVDSVIHICLLILFQILFSHGLSQSIEQSSLCYTVGPCWLSVLCAAACLCPSQPPDSSFPHVSSLVTGSLLLTSVSLFLFCELVHLYDF